jgi:hypothetical protein
VPKATKPVWRHRAVDTLPDPETGGGAVWWRGLHQNELDRWEGDVDRTRRADNRVVEMLLPLVARRLIQPTAFICSHCSTRLDATSKPMVLGNHRCGWFHDRCYLAALAELIARARAILIKLQNPRIQ